MLRISDRELEVGRWNISKGRGGKSKQRRFFSLTTSIMLLLSILMGLSVQVPNVRAGGLDHTVGELDVITLTDYGRILMPINWGGHQTSQDSTSLGFIGLVVDHDKYDHTPGAEDIADSFGSYPYMSYDDFQSVNTISMIIDSTTTQKSYGSFQNKGGGTGYPDDILISQTCWTVKNKDWAMLQWTISNVKSPASDLNNVRIGLEVPISKEGGRYGLGGLLDDGGDDVDGYDAGNAVYWAQDKVDKTTIGFASAIASDPITHYYAEDYHADYSTEYVDFFADDSWLYQRISASSATATNGVTPGNITATIGWDGFDILAGQSRTFTLVMAMNDTYNSMITAIKDAQHYFNTVATCFQITEFSDSSSGTQQIELYNFGRKETDLVAAGYRFSVNGGATFLSGSWDKNPLPTYDYGVFTFDPGEVIGQEGDTIGLYQDVGGGNYILRDEVEFGQKGVAPDSLNGESVARRFDTATISYTDEWLRNSSSSPTWGSQNDVLPIEISPSIILNEVMFNPSVANGGYVVIMNKEPTLTVNVRGYSIVCDTEYRLPDGVDILLEPLTMLIIKYSDDPPSTSNLFDNMDSTGDNVYLYNRNGRLMDMVGWNSQHLKGSSVRRSPDGFGTYQGYNDVTSQAAGWAFNTHLEAIITEISDSASSPSRIEVYNPWYPPIDFGVGFSFRSSSSGILNGVWTNPIADYDEYAIFRVDTPGGLNPEGDTLSLNQNGDLVEQISYGRKGVVPDPLQGESVERYWNGTRYTDVWERNRVSGPTFGSRNDVPKANFNSILKLNEIMFYPNALSDGFVELYITFSILDISGYKIVGDTEYIVPAGTVVTSNDPFFYLTQPNDPNFFTALNSPGDNVYLYDNNGSLLDMVGWSSSHTRGKTMNRVPNGNGSRDGFDDASSSAAGWVFDCTPTMQFVKVSRGKDTKKIEFGNFSDVVYFNLTLTNKQSVGDNVHIFNSTLNGYPVRILDETGTFIIYDIFIPAGAEENITVMVVLPSTVPFIEWDNITFTVQSENNPLFRDSLNIRVVVTPFIWPEKSCSPQQIYMDGTGHDEISTITLNLSGLGSKIEFKKPQEVIFCVDTSGSMTQAAIDIIKIGLIGYVDKMEKPDKGALVIFNSGAMLMNPLSDDYEQLKNDITAIPSPMGSTYMGEALQVAIDELLLNGNSSNIRVIILLTDGFWNGFLNPIDQARRAADDNITIFTIGLGPSVDEFTLQQIADLTGGQYFYADDPSQIPEIYRIIAAYIGDLAGRDIDIMDANPMVRDVLPPWVNLVNRSFSLDPATNYVNETGYRILEWNISAIAIGESWEVSFQVKSSRLGWIKTNDVNNSRISYVDYFDSANLKLFPECQANVLPPQPLPPKLYIDILPNEDDILLYWDEPTSPGTDHYLIYRATSPIGFDFSSPWVDTNDTLANGIDPIDGLVIPSRRTWNHTEAADPGNAKYSEQWYYCIRTVNILGEISRTSRTVGKWTKIFLNENTTFSLPLEPLVVGDTEFYAQDMNATFIKWMNSTHEWVQHDKGEGGDNTDVEVGKGYEVSFANVDKKYTFLGMPGAMIRYNSGGFIGFNYKTDAKSLSAAVDPLSGDVKLVWDQPLSMNFDDIYYVYYSTTRDGFDGVEGSDYILLPGGTISYNDPRTIIHAGATLLFEQLYYMVIPVNEFGFKGASTYSIGVWTASYLQEYDTIAIPLILDSYPTADWYCENIPDAVGINYYINSIVGWGWHSTRMPEGAYDPVLEMTEGYQISTSGTTKFTFIGI